MSTPILVVPPVHCIMLLLRRWQSCCPHTSPATQVRHVVASPSCCCMQCPPLMQCSTLPPQTYASSWQQCYRHLHSVQKLPDSMCKAMSFSLHEFENFRGRCAARREVCLLQNHTGGAWREVWWVEPKRKGEAGGTVASRATEILRWPSADRAECGVWPIRLRPLSGNCLAWPGPPGTAGTDTGSCLGWARVLSGTDDAGQPGERVFRISVSIVFTQHG